MLRFGQKIIVFLLTVLVVFNYAVPVQAATNINPQLEEQILQIIREHPEIIIESVQAYQQEKQQKLQQELQQKRQTFLQQLQANPQAIIDDSPIIGATNTKVVLIEFSDFECPYCEEMHKILKKFIAKHKNEVTLVYKHLPLINLHAQALFAAQSAYAASQQGKFWEYHDALFKQQKQLNKDLYMQIAQSLNLDLDKFAEDLKMANLAIAKDLEMAGQLGISGTPFFIISSLDSSQGTGKMFSGAVELSKLEEILQEVS
jgi:protein-disulfide isomerase